jgi:hypothetical protein
LRDLFFEEKKIPDGDIERGGGKPLLLIKLVPSVVSRTRANKKNIPGGDIERGGGKPLLLRKLVPSVVSRMWAKY